MVVTTHTHQNGGQSRPLDIDASRMPVNHVTPPPQVVSVGPQMFHKPVKSTTPLINGKVGVANGHTTPLEVMSMSPQLTNTLEHIVGQLDILTQVRS